MSWCETDCKINVPLVKQNVMKVSEEDRELIRTGKRDGVEGAERG